jgi:outer membrane receptor protein involved in Fe transport
VVDASVRWDTPSDIGLTVKAENLFDERYASTAYYSSTWLVGKPRTLSFVVDYRF